MRATSIDFIRKRLLFNFKKEMYRLLTILIALVWLITGLFCKVLNLVPRHQQIVSNILGEPNALLFTRLIGTGEILIAIAVISAPRSKLLAFIQILLVAVMNIIESILVPDLLLFGRWNALPALAFIIIIWYNHNLLYQKKQIISHGIPA